MRAWPLIGWPSYPGEAIPGSSAGEFALIGRLSAPCRRLLRPVGFSFARSCHHRPCFRTMLRSVLAATELALRLLSYQPSEKSTERWTFLATVRAESRLLLGPRPVSFLRAEGPTATHC